MHHTGVHCRRCYCFTSLRPTILNVKEFFGDRGITTVVRFKLNLKYTMIFPLRTLACSSQNVQIYYEYTVENSHISYKYIY